MASPQGVFYQELGRRVRRARRAAHITQAALGFAVGLSRTSITNIEKGRQPVYADVIAQMAAFLHVNLSVLVPAPNEQAVLDQNLHKSIRQLTPKTQAWVRRVIAGQPFPEVINEGQTEIHTGPKESTRTRRHGASKETAGSS